MKRISHDLPGVTQRIAKLREELMESASETQRLWQDEKGQGFFQQHIADVGPILGQLTSKLAQTIEVFEDMSKKVQEPNQ